MLGNDLKYRMVCLQFCIFYIFFLKQSLVCVEALQFFTILSCISIFFKCKHWLVCLALIKYYFRRIQQSSTICISILKYFPQL